MSSREYVKYQDIKFFCHPYHKDYLASRCGKILSLKWNKKRILKFGNNGKNYLTFVFYENNKKRDYLIHRFVFETFKGEIPSDKQVDHVDNCKENNSITNLQLLTPSENTRKNHFKKKVFSLNIETQEKKIFDSLKEVAEFYQIHKTTVFRNCQKITKITKSKKDGKRYKFFYL